MASRVILLLRMRTSTRKPCYGCSGCFIFALLLFLESLLLLFRRFIFAQLIITRGLFCGIGCLLCASHLPEMCCLRGAGSIILSSMVICAIDGNSVCVETGVGPDLLGTAGFRPFLGNVGIAVMVLYHVLLLHYDLLFCRALLAKRDYQTPRQALAG